MSPRPCRWRCRCGRAGASRNPILAWRMHWLSDHHGTSTDTTVSIFARSYR